MSTKLSSSKESPIPSLRKQLLQKISCYGHLHPSIFTCKIQFQSIIDCFFTNLFTNIQFLAPLMLYYLLKEISFLKEVQTYPEPPSDKVGG